MKLKCLLLIAIIFGLGGYGLSAEAEEKDTYRTSPAVFQFDPFLVEHLPGGSFYPFFLENYAPDTTMLLEENDGFSLIDNPRVYFEGDSFIHFNWFYNGVNINSALNDGSPAVLLPLSTISGYRLQGENPAFSDYGLDFLSPTPRESYSKVTASTVFSDLGSYWFTFMIQPDHPSTRADRLYNERRRIDGNFFLDYQLSKKFDRSHLLFAVNYFDIRRQFNDFNTFDDTFKEDGKLFLLNTSFQKELSNGHYRLFALFNYLDRTNQQAELGAYPQETLGKERLALLAGFTLQKKRLRLTLSLQAEKEELTPFEKNFSKDLVDNDGDLTLPYGKTSEFKQGEFTATTLNARLDYPVSTRLFNRPFTVKTFADIRFTTLTGKEDSHDFNALLFDGDPYQVVLWNPGSDYSNTNLNANAGMNLAAHLSKKVTLLAKLFVNYNRLAFDHSANNMDFITPGFDVGLRFQLSKRKKSSLLLAYGILPYNIRENSNSFLEQDRPYGTLHRWNDANGDSAYQPGEEGSVSGTTGGRYHHLDPDLSAPVKERILLNFSTRFSPNYTLNIKAIYKKLKNNLRVRFDRDYGFYETHDGHDLYFFDQPFSDYYLGSGGYDKDPFYAQFHFNFKGRKANRWFYSFSFMAHMGMGDSAFGNGPASSDMGILDESQANPNSLVNGFGRLDGDRGFVAKSYFGRYITKQLFLAVSFKYRDGNPFAFFSTLTRHDQRIIYYSTIKAENEKGIKGGPREDYIADVSFKLSYKFKLFNRAAVLSLSFFNVLDFGGELSEYVYSGGLR
ncbi:MAG: hypothetical protein GY940_14065, partial [bacterium]|nr:hypothetical protein [bacterium]